MLLADWYRPNVVTNAHGHERVSGYVLHRADVAVHISGVSDANAANSTLLEADHERLLERVVVLFPARFGMPQRNDELRNIRGRDGNTLVDRIRLIDVSFAPGAAMYYTARGVIVRGAD